MFKVFGAVMNEVGSECICVMSAPEDFKTRGSFGAEGGDNSHVRGYAA